LLLIEDACHAVGARYGDRPVGSLAHFTAFSFHPVKHLTCGEGGIVTTDDQELAIRLKRLRNHGITSDHRQRERSGTWRYDMVELGYNYRLTDIQCALGLAQLAKMPGAILRRQQIARQYAQQLQDEPLLVLPAEVQGRSHAWHLYPVRLRNADPAARQFLFEGMRAANIGVNVHYVPVYQLSYYQALGYADGLCPVAERAYSTLLSLPMWHGLTDADQSRVIERLKHLVRDLG
jgi:perosamine synthetase